MNPEGVSNHVRIGTQYLWDSGDYYRTAKAMHHAVMCTQFGTDDWWYLTYLSETAWYLYYESKGRVAA